MILPPIPKFYKVDDTSRDASGFSPDWRYHILRVKVSELPASQEYDDILGSSEDEDSIKNNFTNYSKELDITDAVVLDAYGNDPFGGKALTEHLINYVDSRGFQYNPGGTIEEGDEFPSDPNIGDYFIRNDYVPKRLFVRQENMWIRLYDNVDDKTWSDNILNAGTFVNNKRSAFIDGENITEKQNLSDVLTHRNNKNK